MKNALLLALVSLTSLNAFGAPMKANLTRLDLDPNAFGSAPYRGGSIRIDGSEATLTLVPDHRCAPGRVCTQMIREPYQVQLPIISREMGRCRTFIFTAEIDRRPVDGAFQRLVIVDHSGNTCQTIPENEMVEITYETSFYPRTGAGEVRSYSEMTAEAFVSAMHY